MPSLRYVFIRSSAIILTPRLPLCQISFFRGPCCWASPWRNTAYSVNYSINYSVTHLPSLLHCVWKKV